MCDTTWLQADCTSPVIAMCASAVLALTAVKLILPFWLCRSETKAAHVDQRTRQQTAHSAHLLVFDTGYIVCSEKLILVWAFVLLGHHYCWSALLHMRSCLLWFTVLVNELASSYLLYTLCIFCQAGARPHSWASFTYRPATAYQDDSGRQQCCMLCACLLLLLGIGCLGPQPPCFYSNTY